MYLHIYVNMSKFLGLLLTSLPLLIFLLMGTRVGPKPKALTAATTIRMGRQEKRMDQEYIEMLHWHWVLPISQLTPVGRSIFCYSEEFLICVI